MDLRDLLAIVRARWIAIAAVTIVGTLVGLIVSLLATPKYQASIQFYVTVAAGDNAAAAYQGSLGAQQRVQSYAALLESTEVAEQVIRETGIEATPEQLVSATSASADAKTVILNLNVTDPDPSQALQIAQGYGEILPETINRLETPEGGGPALAKLTVVNPPKVPSAPVSPRTEQNILIGAGLGLAAGLALALAGNALDRRVKTKLQLEKIAEAPVVGMIPYRKREDTDSDGEHIVPFREGHSPAAEAFRRLRTNLQFLRVDNPPKLIVLTSSVATEGKSETAVNLSLSLAEAGNSVLLVEADLRRPRIVTYLSMPNKVGLTNVLSGQARLDDVIQSTRFDGVDLLACGPLPPNPSELLASDMARRLLDTMREEYDYVIIDSPPLLPVTDGALLARMSDGAILVVRSNRTTGDQVAQAIDNLRRADAQVLGTIMVANKPIRKTASSYYDTYYYSASSPGER